MLEIRCVAGLLAGLLAARATPGLVTGIDRSPAMIAKALKRNRDYATGGSARFIKADFLVTDFPEKSFDRIVVFNVNFV